jgi:hypothetical protein
MSTRRFLAALSVLAGGALITIFAGEAKAADCLDRCLGGTVTEAQPPIVHRTFKQRIEVKQGVYEISRQPALYGWVVPGDPTAKGASYAGWDHPSAYGEGRRVLLRPYRNIVTYDRAKHIYPKERLAIQPEGYGEGRWWDRLFD